MKVRLVILMLPLLLFLSGCSCQTKPAPATTSSSPPVTTSIKTSPELSDIYALQLAQKFCPAIYLDGDPDENETYDPNPIQVMIDQSLLRDLDNPSFSQTASVADLQKWPQDYYYLDVMNLEPKKNSASQYKAAYDAVKTKYNPAVYARIKEGSDYTVIQYWPFYYFNDWRDYHEGDWELVQLNFPGYSPRELMERGDVPILAAYSQHQAGQKMSWADMQAKNVIKDGTHPIVYVAHGSHANYFAPGQFWSGLDFDVTGTTAWRIFEPDQLDVILLHESEKDATAWLGFQGYWGEYLGFSISVLELTFQLHGPFGPQWSDGGKASEKWENPVKWTTELPEYPKPFWISFLTKLGDWAKLAVFSLFSPADLNVYDAQGNHVGFNKAGVLETQIPGAVYINPPGTDYKMILIPNADNITEYRMEIKGTDTGVMDVKAQVPGFGLETKKFVEYTDVPVTAKLFARATIRPVERSKLAAAPGITAEFARDTTTTLEIDSNGDGVFDTESTPGSFEKTKTIKELPNTSDNFSRENNIPGR